MAVAWEVCDKCGCHIHGESDYGLCWECARSKREKEDERRGNIKRDIEAIDRDFRRKMEKFNRNR